MLCVQRWYSAYLGCNEWLLNKISVLRRHIYVARPSLNGNVLTNQMDVGSEKPHEVTRCYQALSVCFPNKQNYSSHMMLIFTRTEAVSFHALALTQ